MISLLLAATITQPDLCALVEEPDCTATAHAIVLGAGEEGASMTRVIDAAADRYGRFFGTPQVPVAVVMGGQVERERNRAIQQAGFRILPWVSDSDKRKLVESQLRKQISEQLGDVPDAVIEQAMQQARAQLDTQIPVRSREVIDGALAHEVAHLWLVGLWGAPAGLGEDGKRGYGSGAPDWIDETAAVLAENAELKDRRRKGFLEAAGAPDPKVAPYPLADYLAMDHPLLARLDGIRERARQSGGSSITILSGDEAEGLMEEGPERFYSQSLAFADFLIETSGDERILLDIIDGVRNATFEEYLAENEHGLPTSMEALDRAWRQWLETLTD